ncbi:MAG: metallophosphoesterase [Eubacteriales bacterium]|nr:metallophosphoesterase [Eubacteriales bacterium]
MKLLFVGDTHATQDLDKIPAFLEKAELSKNDAIIHLGDIGVFFNGAGEEAYNFWSRLPYKVLVCLGNHEQYEVIKSHGTVTKYGCRGFNLSNNIFAPLPGQTARLGGKKLWFYTGAFSVDFSLRTLGQNIFKEELLENELSDRIIKRLLKRKNVDYIVSHDGPVSFIKEHFGFPIQPPPLLYWSKMRQTINSRRHAGIALDTVYKQFDFYGKWYFGHHHRDCFTDKVSCLWNCAVLENTRDNTVKIIEL